MFHPIHTFINKTVRDLSARPILQDIYIDGKLVYDLPVLDEIKDTLERTLIHFGNNTNVTLIHKNIQLIYLPDCWNHKMATMERMKKSVADMHNEA